MAQANPWDAFPAVATGPLPSPPKVAPEPTPKAPPTAFDIEDQQFKRNEEVRKAAEFKSKNGQKSTPSSVASEQRARIVTSLDNLRKLRKMVKGSKMGTGSIVGQETFRAGEDFWGLSGLFNQRANDVAGAVEMVQGDLINQVRNEMQQSGAPIGVKGADTEKEASRLAASIANLAQTQDESQFLVGVDRAEQYYRRRLKSLPRPSGDDVPIMTPEQVRKAPKGTRFRTTDGRTMVRQ